MSKPNERGPYMKTKIRSNQLSDQELQEFMNKNCKARSLFPYAKLGGRVFYPADLIVETLHKNLTQSQAR
jgi:hypothetical protein